MTFYTFIIFHSTIDPNDDSKRLANISGILRKSSRLIVHTIEDLNRLKSIGLIDNVCLIPHGILDFKPKPKKLFRKNRLFKIFKKRSIATFGYCLPNKGYTQLIEAVAILKDENFDINLNIFSAIYSDTYQFYYQELIDFAILSHTFNISDDYLSI